MPRRNLENLRESFEAFERGDKAAWVAFLDPDCENFPPREWPESAPVRGASAIWDFFMESLESWEEGPFEWSDPIAAGDDKVLAHQRREMRGRASGAEVVWSFWVVFTFSEGKVARIEWFSDRAEAAAAAGLRDHAEVLDTPGLPQRQSIHVLRSIYAEWSRGEWRTKFEVYDPGMEWGWSSEFPDLAGVYVDAAERNERLHAWLSPWEDWRCEAEEFVEHGDYVVALCRYRGRGKGSGATVDTRGAHVWKLRAGKVVRLEVFADPHTALESVGAARRPSV